MIYTGWLSLLLVEYDLYWQNMIYTGLLSLLLAEYAANQKCSAVLLCSADSIYPVLAYLSVVKLHLLLYSIAACLQTVTGRVCRVCDRYISLSASVAEGNKMRCLLRGLMPNSHRQVCYVLCFSRPRSDGWPHHERTFSINRCHLSFWLTLPRRVLSTSWCCPSRPCVLPRLRAPYIVPCSISFSRQRPCFLMLWP